MPDITIDDLRVAPVAGTRTPATVKAFPRSSFLLNDANNTAVTESSPYNGGSHYKSQALTADGAGYTAADFTLPSTTDSPDNPNGAKWGLFVFDTNDRLMYAVAGLEAFQLDHTDLSQTAEEIIAYNSGGLPVSVSGDRTVSGDLLVEGDLQVNGAITSNDTLQVNDDVNVSGNVTANAFVGNGAGLTGVASGTGGVTNTGSTTVGADTDSDGVGIIDLQTRVTTRLRIRNAGETELFKPLIHAGMAKASLPAAGNSGAVSRVTDEMRGLYMDNGSSWNSLRGFVNVHDFGALGNGAADDTSAINAAIAAANTVGGVVFFPPGTYLVSGAGTELFLITRNIILQGVGYSSRIVVSASVGAGVDIFRYAPTTTDGSQNEFFGFRDLAIVAASGTPGRHAINIDCTPASVYIARVSIERNHFGPLGGRGIVLTNPTNTDGFFCSNIERNSIHNGIQLTRGGDTIIIRGNTITGNNPGVEADLVTGATTLLISQNNITSKGGAIKILAGYKVIISQNIMELFVGGSTGSNGAVVDLDGSTARLVMPTVVNNVISSLSGISLDGIRVHAVDFATISDNTFNVPSGKVGARFTSSSANAHLRRSRNDGVGATHSNTSGDPALTFEPARYEVLPASNEPGFLIATGMRVGSAAHGYAETSIALTLGDNHGMLVGLTAGGAFTVTLPVITAAMQGRIYTIMKGDTGANVLTVARSGSDTINGATSYTAINAQYKYVTVVAGASGKWLIIGAG